MSFSRRNSIKHAGTKQKPARQEKRISQKLQTPDKEQRKEAIKELAGFSFDDKVRQALENVLLSDPDPELRKEAAQAFGKVKNTKALRCPRKSKGGRFE